MNWQKIILTVFALIALYLILANGNAFNVAFKTATNSMLQGVAILQGRDGKVVE